MARYELMVILHPEIQDEELNTAVDRIKQLIADRGGTAEETDVRGRRRLAYPIKARNDGTMLVSQFDMSGDAIAALKTSLSANDSHLRTFVTRI